MVAIYQEQGIIFTRKTELELEKITVLVKKILIFMNWKKITVTQ